MKKREVTIIHEIVVRVDLKHGARLFEFKHAVYKTAKNFIRVTGSVAEDYTRKEGFSTLIGRVDVDAIMMVSEPGLYDSDETDDVRRKIWCYPEQREEAAKLVRDAVERRVQEMKQQVDQLHALWTAAREKQKRVGP